LLRQLGIKKIKNTWDLNKKGKKYMIKRHECQPPAVLLRQLGKIKIKKGGKYMIKGP
jgi:hypothetical protein